MSLHSIDLQRVTEITQEERSWALNIKAAVEEAGDIQNVSDFEYVHHAFVARDNIGSAVERIRGLQFFREEYHINDTVEEGMELIHAFLAQQPKWLLTVDIDPEKGHFVYV